jgi:hypothetical protein
MPTVRPLLMLRLRFTLPRLGRVLLLLPLLILHSPLLQRSPKREALLQRRPQARTRGYRSRVQADPQAPLLPLHGQVRVVVVVVGVVAVAVEAAERVAVQALQLRVAPSTKRRATRSLSRLGRLQPASSSGSESSCRRSPRSAAGRTTRRTTGSQQSTAPTQSWPTLPTPASSCRWTASCSRPSA